MRRSNIAMLLLVLYSLSACTVSDVSNRHNNIPSEGWHLDSIQSFAVDITQPQQYDVSVFVRHNTQYQYSNLWLFVEHQYNGRNLSTDTLNIALADPYGRWQGNGWGATYQVAYPLIHKQPLDTGTHVFNITQAMRDELLQGVINVGVSVKLHQD